MQAVDSRDALAKAIYANLFDWLVDRINKSLKVGKWRTGRCISILDIYGFESFKVSSRILTFIWVMWQSLQYFMLVQSNVVRSAELPCEGSLNKLES